jgi:tetratricopeptide (TPR) repeat protein
MARAHAVRCLRTWGQACYVGEGETVTLDVSNDLLRRQITVVGSWTFSSVGQGECARYIADRGINLDCLFTHRWKLNEAEAAYRAATKADPGFAEAWYNLADVLDEQTQSGKAIGCLKRAVEAEPDYADAIFNLGLLHQRGEKHAEAAAYWRRYLALDSESPWASRAKRALKLCEMQIAQSS